MAQPTTQTATQVQKNDEMNQSPAGGPYTRAAIEKHYSDTESSWAQIRYIRQYKDPEGDWTDCKIKANDWGIAGLVMNGVKRISFYIDIYYHDGCETFRCADYNISELAGEFDRNTHQ